MTAVTLTDFRSHASGMLTKVEQGETLASKPDLKYSHRLSADEMLLDDLLQHIGGAGVIPDAFWIDDRHRPVTADP